MDIRIKEILKRPESRHSCRPDIFYFFAIAHFFKQLPTHIAHIAKAPQSNAATKALSKSAILPARTEQEKEVLCQF